MSSSIPQQQETPQQQYEKLKSLNPSRVFQLLEYTMLRKIDKVCRENHIDYWLGFGTLLGAVRHDGFIPWDDDIDICMPIEHYKRFMEIANSELAPHFKIIGGDVSLLKVMLADNLYYTSQITPLVDVFAYYPLNNVINVEQAKSEFKNFKIKNLTLSLTKKIKRKDELIKKFYASQSNILGIGLEWTVPSPQSICLGKEIYPLQEHIFKKHKFFIPHDYDSICRREYGDYMKLPTEQNRNNFRHFSKVLSKDNIDNMLSFSENFFQICPDCFKE
jgi:lipopolysaccharide cholinephosphotransferase